MMGPFILSHPLFCCLKLSTFTLYSRYISSLLITVCCLSERTDATPLSVPSLCCCAMYNHLLRSSRPATVDTDSPENDTSPFSAPCSPAIILNAVLLPAPFGPSKSV